MNNSANNINNSNITNVNDTNSNDNNITYCSRCGAEMRIDSRYCMKCGNLNPNHDANKSMAPFFQNQSNAYQVGKGSATNIEKKAGDIVSINKSGGKLACYIFNIILFFLVIAVETLLIHSYIGGFNGDMLSLWASITFGIAFLFLMSISLQIVYMKANKPWWFVFVPILNYFVYFDIACEKWTRGLYIVVFSFIAAFISNISRFTSLLSIVIYVLIFLYFLKIQGSFAKKYSHSSLLYILFPFIMLPIIAFDGCLYKGIIYTSKSLSLEKDYKFRKFMLFIYMIFLLSGLGITLYYRRNDFVKYRDNLKKEYYVYVAKQVYYEANSRFSNNQISCEKVNFSNDNGTYYLYYPDTGRKIFLLFYFLRESIESSVKIVVENGEPKYYISLTDGVYGIDETLYEEINVDKVVYKRELGIFPYEFDNYCEINYGTSKQT